MGIGWGGRHRAARKWPSCGAGWLSRLGLQELGFSKGDARTRKACPCAGGARRRGLASWPMGGGGRRHSVEPPGELANGRRGRRHNVELLQNKHSGGAPRTTCVAAHRVCRRAPHPGPVGPPSPTTQGCLSCTFLQRPRRGMHQPPYFRPSVLRTRSWLFVCPCTPCHRAPAWQLPIQWSQRRKQNTRAEPHGPSLPNLHPGALQEGSVDISPERGRGGRVALSLSQENGGFPGGHARRGQRFHHVQAQGRPAAPPPRRCSRQRALRSPRQPPAWSSPPASERSAEEAVRRVFPPFPLVSKFGVPGCLCLCSAPTSPQDQVSPSRTSRGPSRSPACGTRKVGWGRQAGNKGPRGGGACGSFWPSGGSHRTPAGRALFSARARVEPPGEAGAPARRRGLGAFRDAPGGGRPRALGSAPFANSAARGARNHACAQAKPSFTVFPSQSPDAGKFICFLPDLPVRNKGLVLRDTGFPGGAKGKEPACQCERQERCKFDSLGQRCAGGGNGNLLQVSCL